MAGVPLGMTNEAQTALNEIATRFLGHCPVCEGQFKLTGETEETHRMVLHGYKRPGDGMVHGQCPGVGFAPYELSTAGCVYYKDTLSSMKTNCEKHLKDLKEGRITVIWCESRFVGKVGEYVPTPDVRFPDLLARETRRTEGRIGDLQREIERMDRLITGWVKKPIRTIEEETARLAAEAEERKKARIAAKAAKLQKRIASFQKRIDSSVRRKTITNLADIFDSLMRTFRYELGNETTREETLKVIDRDHVWAALGFTANGTVVPGYRDHYWDVRAGKVAWPESLTKSK